MSITRTAVVIWNGSRGIPATRIDHTELPNAMEIELLWEGITQGLYDCHGKTNSVPFLGEPTETLVVIGYQSEPRLKYRGSIVDREQWLTIQFRKFPNGVNKIESPPKSGHYYRVTDAGGVPLFTLIDFAYLLAEAQ
jgi:hypothetical protein